MEPDAAAYVERRRARRPTRPRADVPVRSRCLPSRFVALGCCLYLAAGLHFALVWTPPVAVPSEIDASQHLAPQRRSSDRAPLGGSRRGANFTRAARAARSAPAGVWVRVSLRKSSELLATVQIRAADTVSQIQRRVEAAVPEGRGWFPASEQTLVRSTDRRLANGHGRDLGAIARKLGGVDVVNISHPALLRDVFDRAAREGAGSRVETTLECHCERLLPRWRHERPAMAGAQPPEFVSSGRKDFRSTVSTALSSHGLKLSAVVALDADVVADAVDRGKQKELRSDAMKEAVRNLIRLPNNLMNARIDAVRQALKSGEVVLEWPPFDVYAGEQMGHGDASDRASLAMRRGAYVLGTPGLEDLFGRKDSLARLHTLCLRRLAGIGDKDDDRVIAGALVAKDTKDGWATTWQRCAFTLRAFNVLRTEKRFGVQYGRPTFRSYLQRRALETQRDLKDRSAGWPQLWLLKPQHSWLGVGIKMVVVPQTVSASDGGLMRWAQKNVPAGEFTLQEYVDRPALWEGRKFDLRWWLIVTSFDPLRIWAMERLVPKISSEIYDLDPAHVDNECMHFKMLAAPGCNASTLPSPYPASDHQPIFRNGLKLRPGLEITWKGSRDCLKDTRKIPRYCENANRTSHAKEIDWSSHIVPKMRRQLMKVILLARKGRGATSKSSSASIANGLLAALRERRDAGYSQHEWCFLSPDFIIDANGQPWLEEVNTNGFIPEFWDREAKGALKILLPGKDERTESADPSIPDVLRARLALIDEFCETQQPVPPTAPKRVLCTHEVRRTLADMVREDARAESVKEWVRVFPSRDPIPGTGGVGEMPAHNEPSAAAPLLGSDDDDDLRSLGSADRFVFEHEILARHLSSDGGDGDDMLSELDVATWDFVRFLFQRNASAHRTPSANFTRSEQPAPPSRTRGAKHHATAAGKSKSPRRWHHRLGKAR